MKTFKITCVLLWFFDLIVCSLPLALVIAFCKIANGTSDVFVEDAAVWLGRNFPR